MFLVFCVFLCVFVLVRIIDRWKHTLRMITETETVYLSESGVVNSSAFYSSSTYNGNNRQLRSPKFLFTFETENMGIPSPVQSFLMTSPPLFGNSFQSKLVLVVSLLPKDFHSTIRTFQMIFYLRTQGIPRFCTSVSLTTLIKRLITIIEFLAAFYNGKKSFYNYRISCSIL